MTQAATMKAVYFEEFGGPEKLKIGNLPIPTPGADEIKIKVHYTAVNPVDWKIRQGYLKDRIPHAFPLVPGWDVAGVVEEIGKNVTQFKKGDKVFAYCRKPVVQWGTYAEYFCFGAENFALIPSNISFAQAAAIPLAGLTAWQVLFDVAKIKKGETIFIPAGAGGVGSLAIQFCKQAGVHVITTASTNNHDYLKRLGADEIIDYHNQNVVQQIKTLAPNGVDVVFDILGGQSLKDSYQVLKRGGRLVSIVEPPSEQLDKQYGVHGYYHFVAPNGKQLQQIADLIQNGKVQPVNIQEMTLNQAAEAQSLNQERHVQGKIVLRVSL